MRIIVAGDRFWNCHKLAAAILRRLVARYGPDLVIALGDDTGVEESFALAAKGQRIKVEIFPCDWERLRGEAEVFRNREMIRAGAALCVIVHRSLTTSKGAKDMARQAIMAGMPTYLIDSEAAVPRRLKVGDSRLD